MKGDLGYFFRDLPVVVPYSPPKRIIAVYFVLDAGKIIYVGKSRNLHSRIETHKRNHNFRSASFHYAQVQRSKLDEIEASFIWRLKPKYNIAGAS